MEAMGTSVEAKQEQQKKKKIKIAYEVNEGPTGSNGGGTSVSVPSRVESGWFALVYVYVFVHACLCA